jgi:hypothetical protein
MIAILEDDAERMEAMRSELAAKIPDEPVIFFDNAPDMIAWLQENIATVKLFSLDHDLGPNREREGEVFDPGIGRDVVDYMEPVGHRCPVVVHSSNSIAVSGMKLVLEDAGWPYERVVPFDDTAWIHDVWGDTMLAMLCPADGQE